MKANIEKVLTEIGDSFESLKELVVMFSKNKEYESKTIEQLRDELRNSITEEEKEHFIKMCMGVGAIGYDESKIKEY